MITHIFAQVISELRKRFCILFLFSFYFLYIFFVNLLNHIAFFQTFVILKKDSMKDTAAGRKNGV